MRPSINLPVDADDPTGRKLSPVIRDRSGSRISDRTFDELVAAIRDLRLPPGQSLSETDLAEQLHVSRTPLREAIARLVDNGLVRVLPQVGTSVALIRLSDVEEARFVREKLELAVFEDACALPVRDVSSLRELLKQQEAAYSANDFEAFFAADEALHAQIFAVGGHSGAWLAVQRMKVQLDRLRRLSLPEAPTLRSLIDEHTLIVDALERGDITAGRRHITAHARRVVHHVPGLRRKHPNYFSE